MAAPSPFAIAKTQAWTQCDPCDASVDMGTVIDAPAATLFERRVGSVNAWEVPGYRLEVTLFGGTKDAGTVVTAGVRECCKAFTNVKTYSLPW